METSTQFQKFVIERNTGVDAPDYRPMVEFFDPASGGSSSRSHLCEAPAASKYTAVVPRPWDIRPVPASAELDVNDPANRLNAILDRLTRLETFGRDWDSYGSQPPAGSAITKAQQLIWEVVSQDFAHSGVRAVPYTAVPLSGGGVQIEWQGPSGSVEIEIGPHCEFGYLMTRQGPHEETEERDNVPEDEILRLIAAVIA
jgi:hypothetical protein